ncbi:MAG: hypothetical protein ACREMW_01840 [Gemmatimonadales bacterium]
MAVIRSVEQFGQQVAAALGGRLVSLVLYGSAARGGPGAGRASINTLLICDGVDERLFAALAPLVAAWERGGHPPPIVFSETEWRASADAFAIEYEDIRAANRLVTGRDPWPGISVRREDVQRQLEHELVGKLVRLRQGYVGALDDGRRLTELVAASASGFFTMLRTTLRLAGTPVPETPAELVLAAAAVIGFPASDLADVVAHVEGRAPLALGPNDRRAGAYLEAVARTADYVNRS